VFHNFEIVKGAAKEDDVIDEQVSRERDVKPDVVAARAENRKCLHPETETV